LDAKLLQLALAKFLRKDPLLLTGPNLSLLKNLTIFHHPGS
jgi:hypothetical protein